MKNPAAMSILMITILVLFIHPPALSQFQSQENLVAMFKRLTALNDTGELDRLISETEREITGSEATAEKCLELGILLSLKSYFSSDKADTNTYHRKALQYIEKALKLSPDLAPAHSILGFHYLYAYLKDAKALSKAKTHFQKALELDPNEPIALDGMRRIALRASPISQKEQYLKNNLDLLASATRSGRKYSILAAKFRDSIQFSDFVVDIKVEDVSEDAIVDFIKAMRSVRKKENIRISTPPATISSIIMMVGEINGAIYSNLIVYNIELNRIVVGLQVQDQGPIYRINMPFEMQKKYMQKQISTIQLFSSFTFSNE